MKALICDAGICLSAIVGCVESIPDSPPQPNPPVEDPPLQDPPMPDSPEHDPSHPEPQQPERLRVAPLSRRQIPRPVDQSSGHVLR